MKNVVDKARSAAQAAGVNDETIMVCERGASFGYNNLVSDMRSLSIMRETGCPVVFDATHSVQLPGGQGQARAASANSCRCLRAPPCTGIAGLFMETHPDPANAKSDGPNAWPLDRMESLLTTLVELDRLVKRAASKSCALGRFAASNPAMLASAAAASSATVPTLASTSAIAAPMTPSARTAARSRRRTALPRACALSGPSEPAERIEHRRSGKLKMPRNGTTIRIMSALIGAEERLAEEQVIKRLSADQQDEDREKSDAADQRRPPEHQLPRLLAM